MGTTLELTVDEIDELVDEKVGGVQKSRVVGEYLPAENIDPDVRSASDGRSFSQTDRYEVWIGKFLQFSKDSDLLRERDLVATRGQLRRMDAWCRRQWGKNFSQLEGHDVTFEVEPAFGYDGRLTLRALRILDVGHAGCWTRAKAVERSRLGSTHFSKGGESRIRLQEAPTKITVIAPRRGRASRSDMRRVLTMSIALAGIEVEWDTRTGFTGRHASRNIARAIRDAGTEGGLVLLARGGGGRADFWPFETAEVAEAILRCRSRVITALGHEENRCLADDVAFRSFAVPRAAADAIVSACGDLVKGGRDASRRRRPSQYVAVPVNQQLEAQLLRAGTERESAITQCRALQEELVTARREGQSAIAARDAAQAQLGRRILQSLEFDVGRVAIRDMRDAVHLRYFSAFPATLAIFYGWSCVIGAEGAHRAVWASCAVLFVGAFVAVRATARHLARAAEAAVNQGP